MSLCHGWRCGPMGKREHTHHKNQQIFSMLMLLLHHVLPLYRFRRVAEITSGSNWNVMVWISNLCTKNRHYQECRTHHHHTKTPPHQQQINDEVFEKTPEVKWPFLHYSIWIAIVSGRYKTPAEIVCVRQCLWGPFERTIRMWHVVVLPHSQFC